MNSFNPATVSYSQEKSNNLRKNLNFAIELIIERDKLLSCIKLKNVKKNKQNEDYFLINKDYISLLNDIYRLKDIYEIKIKSKSKNKSDLLNLLMQEGVIKNNEKLIKFNKDDIQKLLDSKINNEKCLLYANNI